jgi:hypothetical protein
MSPWETETSSTSAGVPPVLPLLALAALAVLPANPPLTGLPPGADPCIALTPAVVDQLRTSGALTPLVPDEIPTSTLIATGRSLTGCPPTSDPDPAAISAHVCPLLTTEGVGALANQFAATPTVRAELGPERVAIARNALHCDGPAATDSVVATAGQGVTPVGTGADRDSSNRADRVGRGVPQEPITIAAAFAALIGVLLLLVRVRVRRRQSAGNAGTLRRVQVPQPIRGAVGQGRQQIPDGDKNTEGQQRPTPEGERNLDESGHHSDSYDELLEGLRRELAELQGADDNSGDRSTGPDHLPDR